MSKSGEGFGIDEQRFEQARKEVASKLYGTNLYDIIMKGYELKARDPTSFDFDDDSGGPLDTKYFPSQKEVGLVDAVTHGAAVYKAVREEMRPHLMNKLARKLEEHEERFLTLFSLYAGVVESLTELDSIVDYEDVQEFSKIKQLYREKKWGTDRARFSLDDDPDQILEDYLDEYVAGLVVHLGIKVGEGFIHKKRSNGRELTPDGNLTGMSYNYFLSLLDYLSDESERKEYADLVDMVEFPLLLREASITGFNYRRTSPGSAKESDFQLDVDFSDIIGNQRAKELLQFSLEKLFLYDPESRENPFKDIGDLPRTVLLYAGPGTGKTMTLKAAIKYAYELSEETGKPLNVVEVSQFFKDKYVGESQKKLRQQLEKGMDPNGIGLITIEDIDELFSNRSDVDANSSQAEGNVLQALLNILEGLKTQYHGNWMVVATSNRAHGIDKALKDRIAQFQENCPGATTIDELIQLTQGLTKVGTENKYLEVSDAEWREIAEAAKEKGYNGRQIRNATKQLLTEVGLLEMDRKLLTENNPDKVKGWWLKKMRKRKVTGKDLLEAIEEAAEHDEEQRRYDLEEKIDSWGERFFTQQRGRQRAQDKINEEDAKILNEEFDGMGEEGKKLLQRLQSEEMKRLEQENEQLREELQELKEEK